MIAVSPLLGNIISNLVLISSSDFGSLSNTNLLIFDRILLRIFSALGGNVFPPNFAKKKTQKDRYFRHNNTNSSGFRAIVSPFCKRVGAPTSIKKNLGEKMAVYWGYNPQNSI